MNPVKPEGGVRAPIQLFVDRVDRALRSSDSPVPMAEVLELSPMHYGVLVVAGGRVEAQVTGAAVKQLTLDDPGMLIIRGPATLTYSPLTPATATVIALPAQIVSSIEASLPGVPAALQTTSELATAIVGIATLIDGRTERWTGSQRRVAAEALVGSISAAIVLSDTDAPSPRAVQSKSTYLDALHLIDRHYRELDFNSRSLAALMQVSVRTLQRVFAEHNSTIASALNARRAKAATHYLSRRSGRKRDLAKAAAAAGFANVRTLRAALRRSGYPDEVQRHGDGVGLSRR